MAVLKPHPHKDVIGLAGPEGSAYFLMACAKDLGAHMVWDEDKINQVKTEMTSGDYDNLISVFDKHFDSLVDLVLPRGYDHPLALDYPTTPKAQSKRKVQEDVSPKSASRKGKT